MKNFYSRPLVVLSLLLIATTVCLSQPSPVAFFPFTVNGSDSSGNANNGTLVGGTISGGTLNLADNATDYFSFPGSTVNGLTDFTISFNMQINTLHTTGASPTNAIFTGSRT